MAGPVESLGDFPIIQIAVAAAIAIGAAVAVWRGASGKPKNGHDFDNGVQWFFDGPIGKALDLLQAIYRVLTEIRVDQQRFADENNRKLDEQAKLLRDEFDEQSELLREIRDHRPRR